MAVTERVNLWFLGLAVLAFVALAVCDAAMTPLGY